MSAGTEIYLGMAFSSVPVEFLPFLSAALIIVNVKRSSLKPYKLQ